MPNLVRQNLLNSKTISKGASTSKRYSFPLSAQAAWIICHLGGLKSNLVTQVKENSEKVAD